MNLAAIFQDLEHPYVFQTICHVGHFVFLNGTNFESNLAYLVPYNILKFQIVWQKRRSVRVQRRTFKIVAMATILFFWLAPISKVT